MEYSSDLVTQFKKHMRARRLNAAYSLYAEIVDLEEFFRIPLLHHYLMAELRALYLKGQFR